MHLPAKARLTAVLVYGREGLCLPGVVDDVPPTERFTPGLEGWNLS